MYNMYEVEVRTLILIFWRKGNLTNSIKSMWSTSLDTTNVTDHTVKFFFLKRRKSLLIHFKGLRNTYKLLKCPFDC